jgi:hypothetical protein
MSDATTRAQPAERAAEAAPDDSTDHPPRGWDSDAFWYPTADRRGALLATAGVLFLLHFDELFGLHTDPTLLAGWLPIEMGYQIGLGLLHVAFMGLLYLNWPSASEHAAAQIEEFEREGGPASSADGAGGPVDDGDLAPDAASADDREDDPGAGADGSDAREPRGGEQSW